MFNPANANQIGQMPWLDRVLGKNPYCPIKFATFENAAVYSFQKVMERVSGQDLKSRGDFLDNFLEAKEQYPDIVGDNEVVSYLMMNVRRGGGTYLLSGPDGVAQVLAGADTTAIVQKAIVYHVLSNPDVLKFLRKELDAASLSHPPAYAQTRDLPYLNAVITEVNHHHS